MAHEDDGDETAVAVEVARDEVHDLVEDGAEDPGSPLHRDPTEAGTA